MSEKCKTCNGTFVEETGKNLLPIPCRECNGGFLDEHTIYRQVNIPYAEWAKRALEDLMVKQNPPAPQSGWSCPRCTRIYGPAVQICCVCNTAVAVKESK